MTLDLTFSVRCVLWTQNANDRMNHWRRSERIAEVRAAAKYEAMAARMPKGIGRAKIIVTPLQGPRGPDADPGAYWPVVKAAVDGLRDAKVLTDDTHHYVAGIELLPAERVDARHTGLRLVIRAAPIEPL